MSHITQLERKLLALDTAVRFARIIAPYDPGQAAKAIIMHSNALSNHLLAMQQGLITEDGHDQGAAQQAGQGTGADHPAPAVAGREAPAQA